MWRGEHWPSPAILATEDGAGAATGRPPAEGGRHFSGFRMRWALWRFPRSPEDVCVERAQIGGVPGGVLSHRAAATIVAVVYLHGRADT